MLKSGKAPEKSNFAQTCNLLSQYLKERGSLADIGLGMATKLETKGTTCFLILSLSGYSDYSNLYFCQTFVGFCWPFERIESQFYK